MPKDFYNQDKVQKLIALAHSKDPVVRAQAGPYLAQALTLPLRNAILSGDVTQGILDVMRTNGNDFTMPLDVIAPGQEGDYVAYTMPSSGYIPQGTVEAKDVRIPTFNVANAIDWLIRHGRDGGSWFVDRAMEVYEAGFTIKLNLDLFRLLIGTGFDRNILINDEDAPAGFFTTRLLSLTQVHMKRNGGGNSGSVNRTKLSDVYLSPEGMMNVKEWNVDEIPESVRTQIYLANDGSDKPMSVYGVRLHELVELGVGQQFQNYYTNELGGQLATGDTELAIGLDLVGRRNFIMPIREDVTTMFDPVLDREGKVGYYGRGEWGLGALDARDIILMSY